MKCDSIWARTLRWLSGPSQAVVRNSRDRLDEELQFHIEQSIEANIAAGMTEKDASRQARIEFGGFEAARETTYRQRPGWLIETFLQDARYALRSFHRNPIFAATVIITLALGIGATTAVFSVVDPILFRPLPYAHAERLVSVGLVQSLERQEFTLGGFYYEWQAHQKPFDSFTFERGVDECNLTEANPIHLLCASVAQNFLPTLGVSPVVGRNFLPGEDLPNGPKAVLLSDSFWLSRYNRDPAVLNKTIVIDDQPRQIAGVLPAGFEMPRLQKADILLPAAMDVAAQHTVNAGIGYPMWAFARLKPQISIAQAKAEMDPLFRHTQEWIPPQFRQEFHLQIRSIRDRQMQAVYRPAWVLLAASLTMLLIASANVAGLLSARGAGRKQELAVRSALGASTLRIVCQTLTEAVLLALAGAVFGFALAAILLRIFVAIAPAGVPFLTKARLDFRIIFFTIAIALLCAAVFGGLAALQKPHAEALVARPTQGPATARLRRVLVVMQIGISLVLVSGASLLLKSFRNLEQQKLGMSTDGVLSVQVSLNWSRYQSGRAYKDFYLRAESALRSLPGVTEVAISNSLPPDENTWHDEIRYDSFYVAGQPRPTPGAGGKVVTRSVTPGFFRILRIPILEGRSFNEEDRNAVGSLLILSQSLAGRLFLRESAIGRHIQFASYRPYFVLDGPIYTVVGVAGNVKNAGLAGQDSPEYYTLQSNTGAWSGHSLFLLDTTLPAAAIAASVQSKIAQIDPMTPVEIEALTETVDKLADQPRFESALLGFFALTGLIMAIIGLYGVTSFLVTQRTREIGVRMALGASRSNILRLVAWEGALLIGSGTALGLAMALAVTQVLRNLLFGIGPRDPGTFIFVPSLLVLVTLMAMIIPARAATRIDPVAALRCE